jgi:hypothetical protein
MQASTNYKNSYDSFGKFIQSRIRKVAGYDEPPIYRDIWKVYKMWHQESNLSGKMLTEREFKIRLNELYQAPSDGKTYKHIRLFRSDDDMEEFDKEVDDN